MKNPIYVTGHKNPDTDSIVSSIAYAEFKRKQGYNVVAGRVGPVRSDTEYLLERFEFEDPLHLYTAKCTIREIEYDQAVVVSKDITVEKGRYREILKNSLDEILAEELPGMKSCLEAKLFGIGLEAYTVGSHDFYAGYCAKNNVMYTLDTGHYEPTENVSDAVSALLLFVPELMLHVSRPMHWDSDHVTLFDDNTRNLFSELVRANALDRAHIGLDYFDGSINRIGAYIIGVRAAQKSLLQAFLEPLDTLRKYEDEGKLFQRLALLEEEKTLPFGAVYDYFNLKNNIPVGEEYIADIEKYEAEVLANRK